MYEEYSDIDFSINDHTNLLDIEDSDSCIELTKEDLYIILDMLDNKINYYESSVLIIYLYENELHLINSEADIEIILKKDDIINLKSTIIETIDDVIKHSEYTDDIYDIYTDNKPDSFFEHLKLIKQAQIYNL